MIELKARIKSLSTNVFTQKAELTVEFEGNPSDFEALQNKDIRVTLKEWRERRSNDANSYFWVLINKLAYEVGKPVTEIYKSYIREIGGNNQIVCVKSEAVDSLCDGWTHNGLGWQVDTLPSKLDGCTNVILYYGSSTYDSKQMSRLLDMVIQDCEAVGIPTMTPKEIEEIKRRWGDEAVS